MLPSLFSKSTLGAVWGTDQRHAAMAAKSPGRRYCSPRVRGGGGLDEAAAVEAVASDQSGGRI